MGTIPSSERSKYETVVDIIKDLSTGKGYAGEDEIVREAKVRAGIDDFELRKIIQALMRDNIIFMPYNGRYRLIE
jgi:DNA replicative helicase MCM subunit Mcm2 (Cdc46/Mcm family)